jgi:dipeptidyl aminopeptidase/acylaminoacyl peptidase
MSRENAELARRIARLSVSRVWIALALALGCLALTGPAAEASYPGRNGLIAFVHEDRPFDPKRPRESGAGTIWVADPRTGRTRQLTDAPRRCDNRRWTWADEDPSFSASGRLIVYVHSDECDPRTPDGIYIVRADGSGRRLIRRAHRDPDPDSEELFEFPAFSPSGRLVAFDEYLRTMHIIRVPRPHEPALRINCQFSSRPRCRTFDFARYLYPGQPSFSATGRLAVTLTLDRAAFTAGHIGTVTPDGKDLRLVTRSKRDAMPDWSPGADRIVFQREKAPGRAYKGDLFVVPARSRRHRRPRRLTETRDAFFPVWSPNGHYIAYVRDPNAFYGPASLWIMRANGRGAKRLKATNVSSDKISWQPLLR